MKRLEKLLQELCPDGVEYKRLGDCCCLQKGTTPIQKAIPGKYPLVVTTDERKSSNTYQFDAPTVCIPLVSSRGHGIAYLNQVYYQEGKFALGNILCGVTPKDHNELSASFLYYYLNYKKDTLIVPLMKGGANVSLTVDSLKRVKVPVPPLEVQIEIIRALDKFIALSTELKAELTAREKQYEYYRNELLKPKTDIPMVTLKEIAIDIYRGSGIKRDQVTEDGIPCVRYGEIYTTYNTWFDACVSHTQLKYVASPKYFEYGDILFAITGESVEDIAKSVAYVGHEKCLAGGDIVVLKHKQNPRYLAHALATKAAREQKSRGKVKSKVVHSNVPSIEQITIPLPPLDVQERYAEVLDNFEVLCRNLQIGLPAEIEARQKQYEYYRDKLLTFKERIHE